MKKFSIKTLAFLIILTFTTCSEDFLTVENINNLSVESWYKTMDDFTLALNSCYCALADGGMFGLQYYLMFQSFEDRILFETTGFDQFNINSTSGNVNNMWRAIYFGLYRPSMLIRNLKDKDAADIPGMNQQQKDNYLAQARGLRAMTYFYLVTIWDSPVYYNEDNIPDKDLQADLTNGNREDFWNQLVKDLEDAIPYLPTRTQLDPADLGRVTKGMAQALLGKAMLFKHYYYYARFGNAGSAEDVADLNKGKQAFLDLINSSEYELIQPQEPKTRLDYIYAHLCNFSYLDLPSENNTYPSENNAETVWQVQYSDERIAGGWLPGWQWSGTLNFQYFSPHSSSFRNLEVHPDLYNEFETAGAPAPFAIDPRAHSSMYMDGDTMHFDPSHPYYKRYISGVNNKRVARSRGLTLPDGTNGLGLKKYYYPVYNELNAPRNDPFNRTIIRYADVLLMYAEIQLLLGDDGSGLARLNEVRQRVDMPAVGALTRDAIKHERDVELAVEGHRWFDLIRWSFDPAWGIDFAQIFNGSDGQANFVVGKNEFMPIPLVEIELHAGQLKQNPGW
ncbi:MAG: hypothetical protein AMS26_09975 [Bacteroides sp. SM23_62]|nr:MAG: hypothetical protein AMS26_09975 [Bacteroides sp. SM23_62]